MSNIIISRILSIILIVSQISFTSSASATGATGNINTHVNQKSLEGLMIDCEIDDWLIENNIDKSKYEADLKINTFVELFIKVFYSEDIREVTDEDIENYWILGCYNKTNIMNECLRVYFDRKIQTQLDYTDAVHKPELMTRTWILDKLACIQGFRIYPYWSYLGSDIITPKLLTKLKPDPKKDLQVTSIAAGIYGIDTKFNQVPSIDEILELFYIVKNHKYNLDKPDILDTEEEKIGLIGGDIAYNWKITNYILYESMFIPEVYKNQFKKDGFTVSIVNNMKDFYSYASLTATGVCDMEKKHILITHNWDYAFGTFAHEFGHYIDFKYDLYKIEEIIWFSELDKLVSVINNSYAETSSKESFACAFSVIVLNRYNTDETEKIKAKIPITIECINDIILSSIDGIDEEVLNTKIDKYYDLYTEPHRKESIIKIEKAA